MKNTLFPELKWGREASSKMDEFIGEEIVELSRAIVTRVIFPTGTGLQTAVTGQTVPDRFRYRSVLNRPKFKIQI